MSQGRRRFKVSAELIVEVTDATALTQAALDVIDGTTFPSKPGHSEEQVRATAHEEIHDDVSALHRVTHADAIVMSARGLRIVESAHTIVEVDQDGTDQEPTPDFAALFKLCRCGDDDCDACTSFQLTPRTAATLWAVGHLLADQIYDDIAQHGDDPVSDDGNWAVLADYPRITWRQDAVWRQQAARAYDDLTINLGAGQTPTPTCPGEEMALHLMLRTAAAALTDGGGFPRYLLACLPQHDNDYNWDLAFNVLLRNSDILSLFDEDPESNEDLDSDENRLPGRGDYRPTAWFRPFLNAAPKDGRQGFRR